MKKWMLFIIAALAISMVNAQEAGTIRINAGVAYESELEEIGINVGGEYLITDAISIAPSYSFFFLEDPFNYSNINIDGRYYFTTDGPYIYGLLGLVSANFSGELFSPFLGTVEFDDSEAGLNIGGGAIFPISESLGAHAQIKYTTPFDGALVVQGGLVFSL